MSTFAILLVLISAFMHAAWNALARSKRSEQIFMLRTLWLIVVIGLAPAAMLWQAGPPWPHRAWVCAAVSGACCGVYYAALMCAYGSGEFTVVYPIARALPVLFVTLGEMVRGHIPTPGGWLGILLVTGACIFIPFQTLRGLSLRTYINRTTAWVLLTALGTTGYTLVDKYAAEAVRDSPAFAALYGYLFFVVAAVVYSLFLAASGKLQQGAGESVGWRRPLAAAVLDAGGYWLILWVYQLAQNAGYVMAFRQFSILVGVVLGVFWFHERNAALRLLAAAMMVGGLILIRLCG